MKKILGVLVTNITIIALFVLCGFNINGNESEMVDYDRNIMELNAESHNSARNSNRVKIDSIYKNNWIGKDYKYDIYYVGASENFHDNLSPWFKPSILSETTVSIGKNVSYTIGASATTSVSLGASASIEFVSISTKNELSTTLSASYTVSETLQYTYKLEKMSSNNLYACAAGYYAHDFEVEVHLQEFKWFGQGDYKLEGINTVKIPVTEFIGFACKPNGVGTPYFK